MGTPPKFNSEWEPLKAMMGMEDDRSLLGFGNFSGPNC